MKKEDWSSIILSSIYLIQIVYTLQLLMKSFNFVDDLRWSGSMMHKVSDALINLVCCFFLLIHIIHDYLFKKVSLWEK